MILLTGASASGKTVVGQKLIEKYGFKKFITTTTRPMRVGEVNDVDYHFVSNEEFNRKIINGEFVEHIRYTNNQYGSEKREIGDNKVLVCEANGLIYYTALKDPSIVTFYMKCDEEVRRQRMILRGDKLEDIELRLKNDATWFSDDVEKLADYTIDSSTLSVDEYCDQIYKLYLEKLNKK